MMCTENNRYLLSGLRRQNPQKRYCEMQRFIAGVEGE